ncbi:MAG: rhomboid family intramembrane serine protease [Treponemataceae bacterium]
MTKSKSRFDIAFDTPVVLSFVIILTLAALLERIFPEICWFFVCPKSLNYSDGFNYNHFVDYLRIFLYPLGGGNWNRLASNIVLILLLAPKVESVFGKLITSVLILITSVTGGVFCVCFASNVIYGTSGIVCMFLILAIYVSIDKKNVPFSFILLAVIYFTGEIISIIDENSLEIFCHFAGALAGSFVGILSLSIGRK